jgi:hypothetical protein
MRPDIDGEKLIQPEEITELLEFSLNSKGTRTIDHLDIRGQTGLAFE